jgi:hypothetical protein
MKKLGTQDGVVETAGHQVALHPAEGSLLDGVYAQG